MKPVTRRLGLFIMAGAAAASTLNGSAEAAEASTDPALAAIAKHRQAAADHLAAIIATDFTERRTDAFYDAEDHQSACCHAEMDAAWDLATIVPTTLAGVAAVLRYVNQIEDQGEEWPDSDLIGRDGWHYQLRQTAARALEALREVV